MPKFGTPMSKSRQSCQTQIDKKYDFDIEFQGHTEVTNVHDT